ncbi:hypothetical protein TWF481_010931 [Arthrobotrys musiformis]|uniref:DRBM domain-containing protein n=1 Tax=Arthrobotrys musiformis TaxID=47236 RepID=A0AAV9VYP5_9PEZI
MSDEEVKALGQMVQGLHINPGNGTISNVGGRIFHAAASEADGPGENPVAPPPSYFDALKDFCRKNRLTWWQDRGKVKGRVRVVVSVARQKKGHPRRSAGATRDTRDEAIEGAAKRLLVILEGSNVDGLFGERGGKK